MQSVLYAAGALIFFYNMWQLYRAYGLKVTIDRKRVIITAVLCAPVLLLIAFEIFVANMPTPHS